MKTILFKIQQFPHLSETFILNQIIMAIDLGYDVKILVKDVLDFEKSTHLAFLKKYRIEQKLIIDDYNIPENKFLRLIKAGLILCRRSDWYQIISFIKLKSKFSLTWIYEVDFYSQFRKTDIIHVQYGTNVHPFDILKETGFLHGKLIVSFHGHDAFFPINSFIQNNGYYNHLFTGDNLIVANTPYLAKQLIKIGCAKNKIQIIPVPVDTSYFYPNGSFPEKNNNRISLISVGRLEQIKGHEFGVLAVRELLNKGYNVRYAIIGEGQRRNELELLINSNDLEEQVKLLGGKSHAEIREELWKSDVFLMTSVTFNNRIKETQGLVTLEGQASGLPVVAFDSGGVKYTILNGKTGFLCEEKNLSQYVNAVEKLILDQDLRKSFGSNAEHFVKDTYSKEVISNKWKEIYG